MRRLGSGFVLALLIISVFSIIQQARTESTTIIVPDDYLTIQEAINAASSGNTIFVRNGTYFENIVVNKTVSLIGEDKQTTVIDGNRTGTCVAIEADNVTISGFKIQYPILNVLGYYLIAGFNCSSIQVLNNYLGAGQYKILLKNCSNCVIEDNYVIGGEEGIRLVNSYNNTIAENFVLALSMGPLPIGPFYGIYLENSNLNCIEHNAIADCDIGMELSKSKNNTIRNNVFFYAGIHYPGTAISLKSYSNENIITENLFQDLQGNTLRIDQSHNCTIHHNDFLSPYLYLVNPCTNYWDNGYSSGGNYWTGYNETDTYSGPFQNETGADGIGDVPYIIDGENRDNYPLMTPNILSWDITDDGYVGIDDIVIVAEHFGTMAFQFPDYQPRFDFNRDGYIGIDDIVKVAEHFGEEI